MDVLTAVRRAGRVAAPARADTDRGMPVRVAGLLGVDEETHTASITLPGAGVIAGVPAVQTVYAGVPLVHVLMESGRPVLVIGPARVDDVPDPAPPQPPDPAPGPAPVVGVTVSPSGSGTWRTSRGAWDRWNVATDVYQAGSAGSGPLIGLAWYGDRFVGLRASSISLVRVRIVSSGNPGAGPWTATLRGCPSGSRPGGAPTFTGDTVNVTIPSGAGGVAHVDLPPSMREALRTGAIRSLGLVGSAYGGTIGTRGGSLMWQCTINHQPAA